jgi:adenylate cyclase
MVEAIARDPNYGPALSFASNCHFRQVIDGRSKAPDIDRRCAIDLARRALQAAPDDPNVMVQTANVLIYFGEDAETMITLVDRALALSPRFARGWYLSGIVRIYAGWTQEGIQHVERALHLSPHLRVGVSWAGAFIGAALFSRGALKRQYLSY